VAQRDSITTGSRKQTADIVLVNSNPLDVTSLILFGRATYRKMVQNLIWAKGYNVIVAINARLLKLRKEDGGDDGKEEDG
jgi:cation transport ATPase